MGLLYILALCVLINLTSSCFITNCPPGGKRSDIATLLPKEPNSVMRRCARCGPGMSGRCFGPRICCSDKLGCLVGPAGPNLGAFLPCVVESLFPEPCSNGLRATCGKEGVCASPGVCCSLNECHADATCLAGSGRFYQDSPLKMKAVDSQEENFHNVLDKNLASHREYLEHPTVSNEED